MKILLVGAGGYGQNYVNILLQQPIPSVVWEGVVDPYCPIKAQIEEANIPVYDTMEAFYAEHDADLAVISTPTFLHCEQSIYALSHGSNVLCEKPLAPTVAEGEKMVEAAEKYGRFLAIGYQWSYSDAIRQLKADVLKGVLGKPICFKTAISWPRNRAYYARGGGWGGKIQKDGRLILDSIASNACAHYLHNMLFLLGDTMHTSAPVTEFSADCYRANTIENFDTCSIRMTAGGAKLYFAASHGAGRNRDPEFVYTFEKARVTYAQDNESNIVAEFSDGSKKYYGDPFENRFKKFFDCIAATQGHTVPICTAKTAMPHVQLIESLYRTVPIQNFAEKYIRTDAQTDSVYVEGLFEALYGAYEKEMLFRETGTEIFA